MASTLFFFRTRRFSCCCALPGAGGGDTLLCEMEDRPLETAESVSESSTVAVTFLLLRGGTPAAVAAVVVDGGFTLPVLYTAKGFRLNAGEYLDCCPDFHGGVESESLWAEEAGGRLICLASLTSPAPVKDALLGARPCAGAAAARPISSRLCDLPPAAPPAAALSEGGRVREECVVVTRRLCDVRSAEETLFTFGLLCSTMEVALALPPPPLLTLWTTLAPRLPLLLCS